MGNWCSGGGDIQFKEKPPEEVLFKDRRQFEYYDYNDETNKLSFGFSGNWWLEDVTEIFEGEIEKYIESGGIDMDGDVSGHVCAKYKDGWVRDYYLEYLASELPTEDLFDTKRVREIIHELLKALDIDKDVLRQFLLEYCKLTEKEVEVLDLKEFIGEEDELDSAE